MHPRSLVSTFVIRTLISILAKLTTCIVQVLYLVSVAERNGLSLKTGSEVI